MTVHEPVARQSAMAAATWLHEHGDMLYSYAMTRLKDADAAEEIVQDTLVTAMESHHRFAGDSSIRTWLVGILRHKLLEFFRKQLNRPTSIDVDQELPSVVVNREFTERGRWKQGPKKWGGEFHSQTERDDFSAVLRACLAKLPPRTAEAFTLAECEDMEVDALQRVLGIRTANHVYVLLHRARMALRQCLERNWFETPRDGS